MEEAKKYDTDKFASGLIDEYFKMFWPFKVKEFSVLEVGYWHCGFLNWLYDNFPMANIYAADILKPEEAWNNYLKIIQNSRIKLFQVDQADVKALTDFSINIMANYFRNGHKFDFIIDDGLHREQETRNTFNALWELVKPGGWYIIEDWAAGYKRTFYNQTEKIIAEAILRKEDWHIEEIEVICRKGDISIAKFKKQL